MKALWGTSTEPIWRMLPVALLGRAAAPLVLATDDEEVRAGGQLQWRLFPKA
jgi:hypothetical protein